MRFKENMLDTFLLKGIIVKVNAEKLNFKEERNKSKLQTEVVTPQGIYSLFDYKKNTSYLTFETMNE